MSASLQEALDYRLPPPNPAQRALRRVASSRPGAWGFARVAPRLDKVLLRLTRDRLALAQVAAAVPVLTLVTTGAKSGLARTTSLLGIPHGDGLALIGTQFGQPGTPSWYFNLRAHPDAEVRHRDRSVRVTAREVEGVEWDTAWARACEVYPGYAAYARRIQGRAIHIVLLTAAG